MPSAANTGRDVLSTACAGPLGHTLIQPLFLVVLPPLWDRTYGAHTEAL
jgi:hypothetical protein